MLYTFKNISVNVSTLNPNWVDNMGDTILTISKELAIRLVKESCTFLEYVKNDDWAEFWSESNEDDTVLIKKLKKQKTDSFDITNADAIIGVYEFCLENPNENFDFDVETEHISWVIHDILHAHHDTAGCTIYVQSEAEADRITESLRITKEQFPNELPSWEFLENLEEAFYSRFGKRLDLDEFKYLEEYEEEN